MTTRELTLVVPEHETKVGALWTDIPHRKAVLVLAHGAGAGMKHRFMSSLASGFAERQIATLRYNFPYMDHGRKAPDRPPVLCHTVHAAVNLAKRLAGESLLFVGGKSMGGRMSSTLVSQRDLTDVRGIVFFGFPLHPPGTPSSGRGDHLRLVNLPMLFLQGTRDKLAELDLLRPLIQKLGSRATLHVVESADHSFHVPKSAGKTDADVVSELIDVSTQWMFVRV